MKPDVTREVDPDSVPPANKGLQALTAVLLIVPVLALLWVGHYAKEGPELAGWPFFIWYQFLWIFICSVMTYAAYRISLVARPHRPLHGYDAEARNEK